jgi:molybdopterin converting factor small subunit
VALDLGEACAERAERGAPDLQADFGDRQLAPAKERLCPLDAPRHQVRVGRLPIRGAELPREVSGRHQRSAGQVGDGERTRVFAVHQIAGTPQMREVGELLWRHDASVPARARQDTRCCCTLLPASDEKWTPLRSIPSVIDSTIPPVAVVRVRGALRQLAGDRAEHELDGTTVVELLQALERRYPSLSGWILDERGTIRRHISVFVNGERGGEQTAAGPGDRVEVVPAITGG